MGGIDGIGRRETARAARRERDIVARAPSEVVVVGAGIVGASIAYHLAVRGVSVTVLDAAEPGWGVSAASFSWLNACDKSPREYHDLNRRALDSWARFARTLGQDVGLVWAQ